MRAMPARSIPALILATAATTAVALAAGPPAGAATPIVAGVPNHTAGDARSAGGVAVFDGRNGSFVTLDQPAAGDGFGTAAARGDFDRDGRDDIAIGAPGRAADPSGEHPYTGAVVLRY